jgi:hypothetical protein
MAVRGTCKLFQYTMLRIAEGEVDLSSDVLKLAIIDDTLVPAPDDTTPTWATYSANEVTDAGNYTADGEALTTIVSAMVAGVYTLTADDVNLAIHASGFLDGAYGILVDVTASNAALGFVQLDDDAGVPVSEQAGPVDIEWAGGVVLRLPANVLTWETP